MNARFASSAAWCEQTRVRSTVPSSSPATPLTRTWPPCVREHAPDKLVPVLELHSLRPVRAVDEDERRVEAAWRLEGVERARVERGERVGPAGRDRVELEVGWLERVGHGVRSSGELDARS